LIVAIRWGFSAREGRPMRAALYARDSRHAQQTLGLQVEAMAVYIKSRGWDLVRQVKDVGSGALVRGDRNMAFKMGSV
jgi:DNA invertase Pin-like site-specific DNA recombinase